MAQSGEQEGLHLREALCICAPLVAAGAEDDDWIQRVCHAHAQEVLATLAAEAFRDGYRHAQAEEEADRPLPVPPEYRFSPERRPLDRPSTAFDERPPGNVYQVDEESMLTSSERATFQSLLARGYSREDALSDALDGVDVRDLRDR